MEPSTCEEIVAQLHDKEDHVLSAVAVGISDDLLVSQRNVNIESAEHFETLPPYKFIFEEYLMKNKPFVLGKIATNGWKSRQDWLKHDGTPNYEFLKTNFGETIVPVANCQEKKYSAQPKTDMTLCEYLQYWESYIHSEYSPSMENLYLKDWHFIRLHPDYEAYRTPVYFTSDWLNEFWDTQSDDDDYRFVYMGPKGSWTPLHADVLRSFSWSANICGRKKWILFPPGEEEKLKDTLGNLVYNVDSPELTNSDKYPNYSSIKGRQVVIQEAGEIIYVPSGWHHQVHNMEDTISINHNWINGCNIDISWVFLRRNLAEVQQEINDCLGMEGWDTQCQMILKASSGTDFCDFYNFVLTIAEPRLKAVDIYTDNSSKQSDSRVRCNKEDSNISKIHIEETNIAEPKDTDLFQECDKFAASDADKDTLNCKREDNFAELKDSPLCPNQCRRSTHCSKAEKALNTHAGDCSKLKNLFGKYSAVPSKQQVLFDLNRLKSVMVDMMRDTDFSSLDFSSSSISPTDLLVKLEAIAESI